VEEFGRVRQIFCHVFCSSSSSLLFHDNSFIFFLGKRGGLLFKVCKISCTYTISHPFKLSMLNLG
jgi:hypothetical protein